MDLDSPRLSIMALAPHAWEGGWMNRQQILSRLGEDHDVLYSHGLWIIWNRDSEDWRKASLLGGFEDAPPVVLDKPPKLLQRWPRSETLDRLAIKLGVLRWKSRLRAFGNRTTVLYVFHPSFAPFIESFRPDFIVYHAYDLLSRIPGWSSKSDANQEKLLEVADLVVASSDAIAEELVSIRPRDVKIVANGGNFEWFSAPCPIASDLEAIPGPRIGYVGHINLKVDMQLIARLASAHPEWSFVFIGPIGEMGHAGEKGLAECRLLPNVHFLGYRPPESLPSYVQGMDVNIMCYAMDPNLWTVGIYPLKMHEYLAAGQPVVSADLPTVRPFSDVIDIATSHEEWDEKLTSALLGRVSSTAEARRKVARQNSWEVRVADLNRHLREMVS
jgi:glycosyltransferase involved in cell wall biosynthesis